MCGRDCRPDFKTMHYRRYACCRPSPRTMPGLEAMMKRIPRTAGRVCLALTISFVPAAAIDPAAAARPRTITCPYLSAPDLHFDVPAKLGALPTIDFDYPVKVTLFSFRDGHLLLVAMDEDEHSRLRIVVSAQRNKGSGSYDGQIVVDMGGNELQLYSGPVSCKVTR